MKNLFRKNWFLITASILLALIIWIYVVYEINPIFETTIKNVPIKYIRYSEDFANGKLTVLSKGSETVNVRIRGKRGTLSKVTRDSVYCSVNMTDVNEAGTHKIPIQVSFDISGIELVSKEPHNVSVQVDSVITREMDISVETTGTPAEGYIYDTIEYSTDKVRITGAKSAVTKASKAKITVDISGKSETQSGRYKILLVDKDGNEITDSGISKNISSVELKCNILRLKKVDVSVSLSSDKTANGKKVTVSSVNPARITLIGPKKAVESIDKITTDEINVSYAKDGSKHTVKLQEIPENVRMEGGNITEAEVTLKVE